MADTPNTLDSTIAEAVKAKVQTMMVQALGEPGELVRQLVQEALATTVENRNNYKKETLLTQIVRTCVVDEAKNAMKSWVESQREAIQAEVVARLVKDKKKIAAGLIDSLVNAGTSGYRINVTFDKPKD